LKSVILFEKFRSRTSKNELLRALPPAGRRAGHHAW
jgi:hypothetical protein